MNKGITLNELAAMVVEALKADYGNKHVVISGDDEGNSFHTLFYGFTCDKSEIEAISSMGLLHDNNNPEEIIILG